MAPRCAALLGAVPAAAAAGVAPRAEALRSELGSLLQKAATQVAGTAWQLSWKSAEAEFSVAAGTVAAPGAGPRAATVQDTFLYGSGSKTYTATMVIRLAEQGVISLDDPLGQHVDPVLAAMGNCSLASLFGAGNASKMTVRYALQMRNGVNDYDRYDFDWDLLTSGGMKRNLPVVFVREAARKGLVCEPGTCVAYSSASYVLAGMVLVRHMGGWPARDWASMDEKALVPQGVAARSMPATHFFQDQPLSLYLTVPSVTSGYNWSSNTTTRATLFSQSSTVLGWTCSNLVAPTSDVARFFWDLLGPVPQVVSAPSLAMMEEIRDGRMFWYGAGLMLQSVGYGKNDPDPRKGDWGSMIGHGGMVYGFNSNQGWLYGLNATLSIVTNSAGSYHHHQASSYSVTCNVVQAAARILHARAINVTCRDL